MVTKQLSQHIFHVTFLSLPEMSLNSSSVNANIGAACGNQRRHLEESLKRKTKNSRAASHSTAQTCLIGLYKGAQNIGH